MTVISHKISNPLLMRIVLLAVLLAALLFPAGCSDSVSSTSSPTVQKTTATSTIPGAKPLYVFAVCGDNRIMGIESGVLTSIVESAKANGAQFIVNTGDVTEDGSRDELITYRDFTEKSDMKFYTVPGNHELGFKEVSNDYKEILGPDYFSFDYAGDHFIILNNANDLIGIDGGQMQWFSSDLAANGGKPRQFIFTHIPVADPSLPSDHVSGEYGEEGLKSGQKMVELAAAYPNVEDFYFGHIHAYLAYELAGIDAYVTGGAGAPFHLPEAAGGYYHYLLVSVYPDVVSVEVVRV